MAQGDTVTLASITERVEVTFQLDFDRAAVRSRADADRFEELAFSMRVAARNVTFLTRATGESEPASVDLTNAPNDAVVRVVFRFGGSQADGSARFLPGDSIDLRCEYRSRSGQSSPEMSPILLGTVKIPSRTG